MYFCDVTHQLIHQDRSFNGDLPWEQSVLFFNNQIDPCCIDCYKTCCIEDWMKLGIEEHLCHLHLNPPKNFMAVKLFVEKILYFRRRLYSKYYCQTGRELPNLQSSWFLSTEVDLLQELEKQNTPGKKFINVWNDKHYLSFLRLKNAIFSISPVSEGQPCSYWTNPCMWPSVY